MATGSLPKWREDSTLPNLIPDEVTIRPELFPADLRDRFKAFFEKALRREFTERSKKSCNTVPARVPSWSSQSKLNSSAPLRTN